jgi:hypothetical protein
MAGSGLLQNGRKRTHLPEFRCYQWRWKLWKSMKIILSVKMRTGVAGAFQSEDEFLLKEIADLCGIKKNITFHLGSAYFCDDCYFD